MCHCDNSSVYYLRIERKKPHWGIGESSHLLKIYDVTISVVGLKINCFKLNSIFSCAYVSSEDGKIIN